MLMERPVTFDAGDVSLEGVLFQGGGRRAALICHPHPMYGGDMHNTVVQTVAQVYQQTGWASLRFNFRGTGGSGGVYDTGMGEREDVAAAIRWLQIQGYAQMDLVGYSFGAWVLAGWSQTRNTSGFRIVLVAPPVGFMDFSDIPVIEGLHTVIVGGRDDFAPADQVKTRTAQWCPTAELHVLDRADHFFGGHLDDLSRILGQMLHQKIDP
jgi:hypothetical protein